MKNLRTYPIIGIVIPFILLSEGVKNKSQHMQKATSKYEQMKNEVCEWAAFANVEQHASSVGKSAGNDEP